MICTGRKHHFVHLFLFWRPCEAPFMQQTVLLRDRRSVSSPDNCGGNSLVAEFDETKLARVRSSPWPGAAPAAGGWMAKIARALASRKNEDFPLRTTADHCTHHLSKGWTKRIYLARGGRISCRTGKVWITLDRGGEDIVLTACESKDFRPRTRVLLEALAESRVALEAL